MQSLYIFFIRNDVWIYIVCFFGFVWYFMQWVQARQILRRAMFGMERERGLTLQTTSLMLLFVFGGIGAFVGFVNVQIAPQLPAELILPPTPTRDPSFTPLASPPPRQTATPTPPDNFIFELAPTATLPGDAPVGTVDPSIPPFSTDIPITNAEATATPIVGCALDLNLSAPREGAVVTNGEVTFLGTAVLPNQTAYRLDINGPQTNGVWASITGRDVEQQVNDSFLAEADLTGWRIGPYLIRLSAINETGGIMQICVTQITID